MGRRRSSPESTPTSPHDYARWLVSNGYIRGLTDRAIVPFIVGHKDEARWVFFILDSGAPLTYLSDQASSRNDMPYLREEANQYMQGISLTYCQGSRERTPWHTNGRSSGAGRGRLSRFPPHTVDKALGLGDASLGGPGGRRQLASSERGV